MFALRRRAIGVSVALAAAAALTATLLISTALAQDPDPSITSITVTDITMTTATVTVNLANDDADGTTVYLKYGPVNTYITSPKPPAYNVGNPERVNPTYGRWVYAYEDADPLESTSLSAAATFSLPDSALPASRLFDGVQPLWASYEVKVEASLDDTFDTGVVTQTFTTLPPEAEGSWVDSAKTTMGIQTSLSSLSGTPHRVYYRWRAGDATTWNTGSFVVPWGNPQTDTHTELTGLVSHSPYVLEVSLDPNFPEGETYTETAWTREPEVVRIGVRKVTETEATVTAIIDHPNGKAYGLGCQYHLREKTWTYVRTDESMTGFVGATLLQSLTANSPYRYRCSLSYDHGEFKEFSRTGASGEKSTHTLDGSSTALSEIRASLSGRAATITIDLVNTDGTNNDVYLRHREYPSTEWGAGAGRATSTDTAQYVVSSLTDNTVHEFEASLDQTFPQAETLTLYLTVGNPPYTTAGGNQPPQTPTPQEPVDDDNSDTRVPNENNPGTLDPNNNNNDGGFTQTPVNNNNGGGGGGGFGSGVTTRNTAPSFRDSAGKMRTVPENSVEDVEVGEVIMAWDPENDPLTFSLRGDDAAPFKIETLKGGYSGQLLVGPDAGLDFEAQSVYTVTVVATDPGGEERTLDIEVQLIDVKLPGKADIFDVQNNHDEWLDKEEVLAAAAAYGLRLITQLEMVFIMKYYYDTNFGDIDFDNLPSMIDKYDVNSDSVIDRGEVLSALQDYLAGRLAKADMQEIAKEFFTTSMEDMGSGTPATT